MSDETNLTKEKIVNLDRAYRSAVYEVYTDNKTIQLFIAENNPQIDLLSRHNYFSWALVTAYNPHSQCLSPAENHQRHQSMLELLQVRDYVLFDGVGKDSNGLWTPEVSVLILGIQRQDALALGKMFCQNAIVYGELNKISQLLWIKY